MLTQQLNPNTATVSVANEEEPQVSSVPLDEEPIVDEQVDLANLIDKESNNEAVEPNVENEEVLGKETVVSE